MFLSPWELLDDFKVADNTTLMFAWAQTSKADEADLAAPSKTIGTAFVTPWIRPNTFSPSTKLLCTNPSDPDIPDRS